MNVPGYTCRTAALVVIVARQFSWPTANQQPNREGLRLRWDALTEDGALLVARTDHPLADGAYVLLAKHGLPGDVPCNMRHEGAAHDSFLPIPLRISAAVGEKRAVKRARLAALRAAHPKDRQVRDASARAGSPAPPRVSASRIAGGEVGTR